MKPDTKRIIFNLITIIIIFTGLILFIKCITFAENATPDSCTPYNMRVYEYKGYNGIILCVNTTTQETRYINVGEK